MAEVGPTTSRRARDSYANQWNRFIAWSQASGRCSLSATPEDVAAHPEGRSDMWAKFPDPVLCRELVVQMRVQ